MRFFLSGKRGFFTGENPATATFEGPAGSVLAIKTVTCIVDMATATGTGTGTVTSPTTMVPAGSLILAVTARVLTILAGASLTTWSLGIGGATTRYGTTLALAKGTTVTAANHLVTQSPAYNASAAGLVFTAAAGVFSTGTVRLVTYYIDTTAPTV